MILNEIQRLGWQATAIVTICVLGLLSLPGCNSRAIYQDKSFNPPVYFGSHVVRPGETLFGIASRYGRDFKELARHNNLSAPYLIAPGQKISLELSRTLAKEAANPAPTKPKNKPNVTKRKPDKSLRNTVTKEKKRSNINDIKWSWPHVGPILAMFKSGTKATSAKAINKGIDIGGKQGDPVKAAAAGEVVYAGNGLLGYGNLVIINHNEYFLSAYAHNRNIVVKEGQKVSRGQKLAEMGSSGTDRIKLHFEIRKNGNPVDPVRYLPRR